MTEVVTYTLRSVCVCVFYVCVSGADIEEKGVRMKLTVIDTPGFGDQINNENWYVVKILYYVECLNNQILVVLFLA